MLEGGGFRLVSELLDDVQDQLEVMDIKICEVRLVPNSMVLVRLNKIEILVVVSASLSYCKWSFDSA